jgi:O-antigen ligase
LTTNAEVISAAPSHHETASLSERLELFGLLSLFGVAAFLQFSIAIAQLLLTFAVLFWLVLTIFNRERFEAPRFFWVLLGYGAFTLISAAFSSNRAASFVDSKQLVLFLIVPVAYRLLSNRRGSLMLTVVMSLGGASAAFGIFQYGLLHFDQLSQRPQGTLGHYMTYAGLLMLVIGIALAKILFGHGERLWAALLMPALVMAVALTSTRTAWVGVCAAAAVLLMLKDFRLLAILPIVAAITFAAAGPSITQRLMSTFDRKDPTRVDRLAMLREGARMVRAHPLVGVGPNMVKERYAEYRDEGAVKEVNPHLHNVPVQIAAERGLPALAIWVGLIGVLAVDLWRLFQNGQHRVLAATALAALASMLAAGLFEYNFGDSEFLMLFLLLVTLPFAAARATTTEPQST